MDHMIGVWWSGAEPDVIPAGEGAVGYRAGTFHAPGNDFAVHRAILEHVYNGNREEAQQNNWGEVLYNRGLFQAMVFSEAARAAIQAKGDTAITGANMRDALEALDVNEELLERTGFTGFIQPFRVTCDHHNGVGGRVAIQQWDGSAWTITSDWLEPMTDVIRPMIEESAAAYAEENDITPASCE
jgi:branched-chain amino acid transport system substrate-binding protein